MAVPSLASLLGYLLRKPRRQQHDLAVAEELSWDSVLDLPAGLEVEWLGTSGFALRYQGHTILIDPYVTRTPLSSVLMRRSVGPDRELVERHAPEADAILIGHAHFDHVLDTPLIARLTGAEVFGSRSTAALMALYELGNRATVVEPNETYGVGPFEITFVPSVHSKLVLGLAVPYAGDISCEHFDELTPQAYKCGDVYGIHIRVAGMSFYHQGSANLIDDAIVHKDIDVFLAGIAGRGYTANYLERILPKLSPRVIVPNHFDDFFSPIDAPLSMSFNVNLAGFVDEVAAVSREFELAVPRRLERLGR